MLSKRRYSAFFQTDLDLWLREHGVARVVVTGVALNICVRSTVHDAFYNGYQVVVVEDASRATGPASTTRRCTTSRRTTATWRRSMT